MLKIPKCHLESNKAWSELKFRHKQNEHPKSASSYPSCCSIHSESRQSHPESLSSAVHCRVCVLLFIEEWKGTRQRRQEIYFFHLFGFFRLFSAHLIGEDEREGWLSFTGCCCGTKQTIIVLRSKGAIKVHRALSPFSWQWERRWSVAVVGGFPSSNWEWMENG